MYKATHVNTKNEFVNLGLESQQGQEGGGGGIHFVSLRMLLEHTGRIFGSCFVDSSTLLTCSEDGSTRVWDLAAGTSPYSLVHDEGVEVMRVTGTRKVTRCIPIPDRCTASRLATPPLLLILFINGPVLSSHSIIGKQLN